MNEQKHRPENLMPLNYRRWRIKTGWIQHIKEPYIFHLLKKYAKSCPVHQYTLRRGVDFESQCSQRYWKSARKKTNKH